MSALKNKATVWFAMVIAFAIALPVVLAGTNPATENGTQPPLDYQLLWPGICSSCHAGYDSGHGAKPDPGMVEAQLQLGSALARAGSGAEALAVAFSSIRYSR